MDYYTRDRRCVSYKLDIDSRMEGKQGVVYRLLDEPSVCLKKYFSDSEINPIYRDNNRHFNGVMFDYFKDEFNHPNFCQLYNLLYDKEIGTVLSFTMMYYEEMLENILDLPIDYLLDNYSLLYDAVVKLAKDCIMVVDLHGANIINTTGGMIVIDFDKYTRSGNMDNRDSLSYVNKEALLYAFYHMMKIAFKKKGIDINEDLSLKYRLMGMFELDSSVSFGLSPIRLKNKLRGCNRTIDYFHRW